jgi:predicted enzyme related to lactoylglutathione lyase
VAKITSLLFIVPVRDLETAVRFYADAFELNEVFRNEQIVFMGIPGTDTAVGVLQDARAAGSGPQNVGFHIDHAIKLEDAIGDVERAGGKVLERGEHAPGVPFARIADLDGNVLEI